VRIGIKTNLKTEALLSLKAPVLSPRSNKLMQNCVCFTNQCINPFVPTFVTRENHPKVLECPTCCSAFTLTCRKHCLGRLKRQNSSIFLELIFVPSRLRDEDPVAKVNACSTTSSGKSKRFILQFPTVTPLWKRL